MEETEDKLDLSLAEKDTAVLIKIGELSQGIIDMLGINKKPCNILLWSDRLKYSEKHKFNYADEEEYKYYMEQIPHIISQPDFVGLHPNGESIQYIKKLNDNFLVGVRLRSEGPLYYRSAYPITNSQLSNYIRTGRVIDTKGVVFDC